MQRMNVKVFYSILSIDSIRFDSFWFLIVDYYSMVLFGVKGCSAAVVRYHRHCRFLC